MEGAIRNGAWVRPVYLFQGNLGEVMMQIKWFKPHLILAHMLFNTKPHNIEDVLDMLCGLRRRGIKVVYHCGDAREEPRYKNKIDDVVDFVLLNHGLLDKFSKIWNVPTYHWPYPCLYQKGIADFDEEFKHPVVFTGQLSDAGVHSNRTKFVKKLKEKIDVMVYPNSEIGNTRFLTAEVASSADTILGVQMERQIPQYMDVRPFQYIGAGALYFHDDCAQMREFFKSDKHFVEYKTGDVDDYIKKYEYYVEKHPDKGQKIRLEGFTFCQSFHGTADRIKYVMDIASGKEVENRIYLRDLPC
uniref:Putative glycosyltransferase n=1 Tax=viral metagenome TaxID=1070528 RepID=A0A6M3IH30_9ZZZZ